MAAYFAPPGGRRRAAPADAVSHGDGKLAGDGHARARSGRQGHLRQSRVLPDRRLSARGDPRAPAAHALLGARSAGGIPAALRQGTGRQSHAAVRNLFPAPGRHAGARADLRGAPGGQEWPADGLDGFRARHLGPQARRRTQSPAAGKAANEFAPGHHGRAGVDAGARIEPAAGGHFQLHDGRPEFDPPRHRP
ncbi:hypothetical protein D3C72_1500640 [compost metagenome]